MDSAQAQGVPPDEADRLERLRWLYGELLRIECHWTAQVQNQQQRISTLLTVTGILLGFLAGAGFLTGKLGPPVRIWWARLYIASLITLCFALLMGMLALKPTIPIAGTSLSTSGERPRHGFLGQAAFKVLGCFVPTRYFPLETPPLWLNAQTIQEKQGHETRNQISLLCELCSSAAKNQEIANHPKTMLIRRILMYRQLVFLLISLVLLIVALAGFLFSK